MPWLTKTIANMGATNVQMAFVPYPEDNQQLDFKWETRKLIKVSASQKATGSNTSGILTVLC